VDQLTLHFVIFVIVKKELWQSQAKFLGYAVYYEKYDPT
jgi:hypothetical protein